MSGKSLIASSRFDASLSRNLFTHILIPTDFSPAAWKAVEVGLSLSDQYGCEISILHIYPVVSRFSKKQASEDLHPKLEKMKEHMTKLSDDLSTDKKTKINNLVVAGSIEKQLLEFVRQNAYDLVIVGVNSSGEHNSPGSHTVRLIEESDTPVLIIPNNYDG